MASNTCFNEESMKNLIKSIIQEEFKKQEQNILNIISGNFKIAMDEIKKTMAEIKSIKDEINDLKESLEFTESNLGSRITTLENKTNTLDVINIKNKLVELEDRSRRNNLRIEGIPEHEGESWADSEKKVTDVFSNNMGIKDLKFERVHRTGRKVEGKHRAIVLKLNSYKDKENILQKRKFLKGTDIYVNEDFCKDTVEVRKKLWEQVKKLRGEGKIAYLNYRSISQKRGDISHDRN